MVVDKKLRFSQNFSRKNSFPPTLFGNVLHSRFAILLLLSALMFSLFLSSGAFAATGAFTGSGGYGFSGSTNNWQSYQPSFNQYYSSGSGGDVVGIGDMWPILNDIENDQCEAATDFVIGIPPGGCTPTVVPSDLLEEQNVPVFCQLYAVRINPLIKVSSIRTISFKGDYPEGVAGISFHPARAAVNSYRTLLGDPLINNIGYVVIILERERVEEDMEEWISGNLTATINYDADEAYGTGRAEYYLETMSDRQWQTDFVGNSFWSGRGFLRLRGIGQGTAEIDVMTSKDHVLRTVTLNRGETSPLLYFPGYYCKAGLKVRLNDLVSPEKMALLDIDGDEIWVREGGQVLDGKCIVRSLEAFPDGTGNVRLSCPGSTLSLALRRKGAKFNVSGEIREVGLGELVDSSTRGRSNYLAYLGRLPVNIDSEASFLAIVTGRDPTSDQISALYRAMASLEGRTDVTRANYQKEVLAAMKTYGFGSLTASFIELGEEKEGIPKFVGTADSLEDETYSGDLDKHFASGNLTVQQLLDYYRSEMKEGGKEAYGEEALYEQIILAGRVKKFKTQAALMELFIESYPASEILEKIQRDRAMLGDFDFSDAYNNVFVSQEFVTIGVRSFKTPAQGESKATFRIGSLQHRDILEDQRIDLSPGGLEYILVDRILPGRVEFDYFDDRENANIRRDTELVYEGSTGSLAGREVYVENVDVTEIAQVSLIPEVHHTRSDANFTFKIGIEKRGIELSPERTQSMIDSLNKTIAEWENINEKLGNLIKGWKGACFATSGLLMVKNMLGGSSGESLARQKVMKHYKEICSSQHPEMSKTQCYNELADDINRDVAAMAAALKGVNSQMDSTLENHRSSEGLFGQGVVTNQTAYVNDLKTKLGSGVIINIDGQDITAADLTTSSQVRAALLLRNFVDDGSVNSKIAKEDAVDALRGAALLKKTRAEGIASAARLRGVSPRVVASDIIVEKSGDSRVYVWGGKSVGDLGIGSLEGVSQNASAQLMNYNGKDYLFVLYGGTGTGNRGVQKAFIFEDGRWIGESALPFGKFVFSTALAGECIHQWPLDVKGISTARVHFYETGANRGLPAIVPFDLREGWYAMVPNSGGTFLEDVPQGYTESADVRYFKICNIGSDGKMDNGFGDDLCQSFDVNTVGNVDRFIPCRSLSPSKVQRLYVSAREAIRQASQQFGQREFSIVSPDGLRQKMGIGSPMSDVGELECQDFMSPEDCTMMFNVCDPVICPTSRCDLGGAMPVSNVIQSGIIGSLALCLPNFKEGILVPICVSGVHAGIDTFVSILKSSRDCLERSLETGEHVGICDEITSIYMCEFFWRQAAPMVDILLPRLVQGFTGSHEGTRGGGEYLLTQNAWDNTQKSIDYFQDSYANNALRAFKLRDVEEAGGEICKSFVGTSFPTSGDGLDSLLEPESPPQFYSYFSETTFSEATVPATSHYKVYYHIYAGNDIGAQYQVYLKSPPQSSYYRANPIVVVKTGYIPRGDSADEAIDFTAPSGYKELCVVINGQPECGFKQVTSSFALDYVQKKYVEEQATNEDITTERECISGTKSAIPLIAPNLQAGAEEAIQPEIALRGIVRVCASINPEAGVGVDNYVMCSDDDDCEGPYKCESSYCTDPETKTKLRLTNRWKDVGYCGDSALRCWLDLDSVKDDLRSIEAIDGKTISTLDAQRGLIENTRLSYEQVQSQLARLRRSIKELSDGDFDEFGAAVSAAPFTAMVVAGDTVSPSSVSTIGTIEGIFRDLNAIIGDDDNIGAGTNANRAEALALKAAVYRLIVMDRIVEATSQSERVARGEMAYVVVVGDLQVGDRLRDDIGGSYYFVKSTEFTPGGADGSQRVELEEEDASDVVLPGGTYILAPPIDPLSKFGYSLVNEIDSAVELDSPGQVSLGDIVEGDVLLDIESGIHCTVLSIDLQLVEDMGWVRIALSDMEGNDLGTSISGDEDELLSVSGYSLVVVEPLGDGLSDLLDEPDDSGAGDGEVSETADDAPRSFEMSSGGSIYFSDADTGLYAEAADAGGLLIKERAGWLAGLFYPDKLVGKIHSEGKISHLLPAAERGDYMNNLVENYVFVGGRFVKAGSAVGSGENFPGGYHKDRFVSSLANVDGDLTGFQIGHGMAGTINVAGDLIGDSAGSEMSGGTINVEGDIRGEDVGANMNFGTINVGGDIVGNYVGQSMKGGTINVAGSVEGGRVGFEMKRGIINVHGSVSRDVGANMKGGWIFVDGDVGSFSDDLGSGQVGEQKIRIYVVRSGVGDRSKENYESEIALKSGGWSGDIIIYYGAGKEVVYSSAGSLSASSGSSDFEDYDIPDVGAAYTPFQVETDLDAAGLKSNDRIARFEHLEGVLDQIKYKESGGSFGWRDFKSWVGELRLPLLREAKTVGQYQISYKIAHSLLPRLTTNQMMEYFGGEDSTAITEDQVYAALKSNENFGRTMAGILVEDNSLVMEEVFRRAGRSAPAYGTLGRVAYDASAYNGGAVSPIIAAMQYSMVGAGVELPKLDDEGLVFDGYAGSKTKIALVEWGKKHGFSGAEIEGAMGVFSQERGLYTSFHNTMAASMVWDAIESEYSKRNSGAEAPLLLDVNALEKETLLDHMNYGLSVAKRYATTNYGNVVPEKNEGSGDPASGFLPSERTVTVTHPASNE